MDSPRHKLAQPHKGVRGKGRGVFLVWGPRIIGDPVLDEHVPSTGSEGLVGFSLEVGRGISVPGGGGGVEHQWEACETSL